MYLGGDLSYINEVEARGGTFSDGERRDPFEILKARGANLARVRLWHTPTWTAYSNLDDVKRTIRRAKAQGMAIMLDFHYSDTWADPAKQIIPAAWADLSESQLEQAVYDYTLDVLRDLDSLGLMPEFVQVGNEINTEILMPGYYDNEPIRWERNARLINAGLRAARQVSPDIQIILHIAQPENLAPWFDAALAAGVTDYDVIGLSYYPKWSTYSIAQTGQTIAATRERYGKDVMIVETAYPWTMALGQADDHLMAEDALLPQYPPTPQGQRAFLVDLTQATYDHGGIGVVYWEPAWISVPGFASIWENAALFDYQGQAHEGIEFLSHPYAVGAQK